jgi:GH15 family glucan-1,4-alpha-glucosidase
VSPDTDGYTPIADYALIGDCHTAALVSKSGSIDWYCPSRFDAPAVFWRILDARQGGYFSISPSGRSDVSRRYRGLTNVLETTFEAEGGRVRLLDFMPIQRRRSRLGSDVATTRQICRLVEAEGHGCTLEVRFKPSFDFGRAETRLSAVAGKGAIATDGRQYLVLYGGKTEPALSPSGVIEARLDLRPGERAWFVLSMAGSEAAAREALDPDVSIRDLQRTLDYWEAWSARCRYEGQYRDQVVRSALALKLLTYEPTGAVVAAPTTSLPELIGGIRNWDYRFTWLRDASLMLYALSTLGYHEEGTDFIRWLAETTRNDPTPRPQIMYTIDGQRELPEEILDRLDGYRGSRPVRIGNGAYRQHQLDIYGDVLSAAYEFRHIEEDSTCTPVPRPAQRMSRRNWKLLSGLVEQAIADWQEPDSGIWEVRGGLRHFVYSKLMCWVAVDRGLRLAREQHLRAPVLRWQRACHDIREAILERGWNPELQAFTQSFDDDHMDASVLSMPRYGFLPATDPRFQSTVDVIRARLSHDGLLRRYEAPPGLTSGPEATFVLCSFWMVDALALSGRIDEAVQLFECLIGYANDVGLLAEEIDPYSSSDRLLGNFPQGFSHMALIGSAVNLSLAEKRGPETRPQTELERSVRAAPAVTDSRVG